MSKYAHRPTDPSCATHQPPYFRFERLIHRIMRGKTCPICRPIGEMR